MFLQASQVSQGVRRVKNTNNVAIFPQVKHMYSRDREVSFPKIKQTLLLRLARVFQASFYC